MKFLSSINVNREYTLPLVDGNAGQALLTDGSGGAYWGTISTAVALNDLTDVIITTPTTGQLLRYNGTSWVNWNPNFLTAESDTLNTVVQRGASTLSSITVGGLNVNGTATITGTLTVPKLEKNGSQIISSIEQAEFEGQVLKIASFQWFTTEIAKIESNGKLTAGSFVKYGGTSSQFLKADGSVDSNTYLTSYSETDTLATVTARGNTTTTSISTTSSVSAASVVTELITASNTLSINSTAQPDQGTTEIITSFKHQTTQVASVNTDGDFTGNKFIKTGGTASQFLKADGSVDSSVYATQQWVGANYALIDYVDDEIVGVNTYITNNFVPKTRTLTINGVAYDLSANRSWTINTAETDTLDSVTDRGNTTTNTITVGGVSSGYLFLSSETVLLDTRGTVKWGTDHNAVEIYYADGKHFDVGQSQMWYVKNTNDAIITKGTVVMATGAVGSSGNLEVQPLVADGSISGRFAIGIAMDDIAVGAFGFVKTEGTIRGIDTSEYTIGTVLYADPAIAGGLTSIEPIAPNLKLPIAFVVSAANNGAIGVRMTQGLDLQEIHDVNISSVANGQLLRYNAGIWSNWTPNFLTSFTETDPVFVASPSYGITTNLINKWTTAYDWGNHADAGYATTSYVTTAIANLVDSAPSTLDTLNELAAALGDDPNFATTVTNSIAGKMPYYHNAISGDPGTAINGVTRIYPTANGPVGLGHFTVFTSLQDSVNYGWQFTSVGNDAYFRSKDTTWGGWQTIATQSWVTSQGYLTSYQNNYISDVRLQESTLEFTGEGSAFTGNIDLSTLPFQPAGSYLTAEADTLATVTGRGASTNTSITVGPDLVIQADGSVNYTASRLKLNSHNNYRGAGMHLTGVDSNWFVGTPYTDFAGGFVIARKGAAASFEDTAQYSNALFTVKSTGNVGIGTTSPSTTLDVLGKIKLGLDGTYGGSDYVTIGFGGTSNGYNRVFGYNGTSDGLYLTSATGHGISFRTNGGSTDNMFINASGNVGIGTSSPIYKLDVAGAVRLTGSLVFDDLTSNLIQHRAGTDVNTLVTVGHGGFDHNGYLRIGGVDVATQTYVNTAIANLVDSAPSTLDTLNELAAALGDDPNFATTVTNSLATKAKYQGTRFQGDLNTLGVSAASSGIYSIGAGYTNGPGSTTLYGTMYTFWNEDISVQIWPTYNGDFYWRKSVGASFTGSTWRTIWDTSHFTSTDITNWNTAYNDKIASAAFNSTNGVLTLTQQDGGTVTVDLDGRYVTSDADNQELTWDLGSKTLGITGGNSVVLDLATEDYVNSQGFITGESDTLSTVVARGSTTSNSISVVESTGGGYLFRTSNGWGGWARHGFSFANGSGTVMKSLGAYGGSGTSLSYMYLGTDYQTNTLRVYNDYVYVPGLDLAMSNSNGSHGAGTYFRGDGSHFVLGLNNGNTLYLNYGNGGGTLRTYGTWYHHDVQILSTSRVLTNVSGNISMFTNDSGYITGYTETDTLATVTARGASTNTALTINADEGLKVVYNGTGGDTWLRGWGIESNRGAVYLRPTTNNTQTLLIGYIDGNTNWGSISVGSAAFTWNGESIATRTWVQAQGYLTSETDSQTLEWDAPNKNLSITNGNTVTLDGLATEEFVTSQGYITGYTEADTLASVTGRGNSTSTTIISTNNANVDGANFTVDTINKTVNEYAYKVSRSGSAVGGILIDGRGVFASGTTINGNTAWHAGNDGSGSGLDADLLDGNHASAFALASHNHDDRYYTESESDSRFVNASGDTMSGSLSFDAAAVIKKKITGVGDNPVKTASGVLASRSDNGGGYVYYVIETNVPQDDYQMGGFTIELFGRYGETNNKTKIDLGGYWNAESNSGFLGFEAHGTNPQYKPTIEVARNSAGKTAFIIYGVSWSYPIIVARDLWLGYSQTDGGAYGEGWSITGTNDVSSYTNKDTVVWRNAYSDSNPAGYITGYSETDTLASVTGRGASTSTAVSLSGGATISGITNNGNLVNNGKIVVQNSTDGGSSRGIWIWNANDSNWGIYMATAGDGKSLAGGTAPACISGQNSHHIRFRVAGSGNGWIWENYNEQTAMSLRYDGGLYTRLAIYPSNQTTHYVDSTRIQNWQTAYGWGNHASYGYWVIDNTEPKNVQATEVIFAGNVTVEGTLTESSSIRFKENITQLDPTLDKVNQLEAVSYNKIGVDDREIGLIAEDVAELFPEVVTYNEAGQPQGIQYQRLSVILLKAMQEQNAVIAALTERVNKLENK